MGEVGGGGSDARNGIVLLTLLWRAAGEFLRMLSEGKLPGLLSSPFLKSDANGGVDDRFGSMDCE